MVGTKTCLEFLLALVLCVNLTHAVSEEIQELIDNLHRECVGQTGVPEDYITNARSGTFSEDPNFKCYIKCIFEEIGVIDDDGKVDEDGMIAMMPDEMKGKAEDVIHGCGTIVGADICDTIWLTNKCYQNKKPDAYFLP